MVKYTKLKLAIILLSVVSMLLMSAFANAESPDEKNIGFIDIPRLDNPADGLPADLSVNWVADYHALAAKLEKSLAWKVDNRLRERQKEIENLSGDIIVATPKDYWYDYPDSDLESVDEFYG